MRKVTAALRYRMGRAKADEIRATIERQVNYVVNHADMMRYAKFRAEGLAIGSGIQEALCKSLVAQRMKRSGMSWRTPGGQAILTARGWQRTGRTDDAWDILRRQFIHNFKIVSWGSDPNEQQLAA